MDIGKYKQAMRPKKYLDGKFVIYDETMPDASDAQLGAREEFAIGGGVIEGNDLGTREGFFNPREKELKSIKNYLGLEKFTKLRIQHKDKTNKEFADWLNSQKNKDGTKKYIPDPKQAKEFKPTTIDRRYQEGLKKGLYPEDFDFKGSTKDRLAKAVVTDEERAAYIEYAQEQFKNRPERLKQILKLDKEGLDRQVKERKAYLKKRQKPGYMEKKAEYNRQRRKDLTSGILGEEAKIKYEQDVEDRNRKRYAKRNNLVFYRKHDDAKSLFWEDLLRRNHYAKDDGKYFKMENLKHEHPNYVKGEEVRNVVLIDKNGNKLRYDTLFEDLKNMTDIPVEKIIKPYAQKAFLSKEGLLPELKEQYGMVLGQRRHPFHIHHVKGVKVDPFDVMLTFEGQNVSEGAARRMLTSKLNRIAMTDNTSIPGIQNYTKKKKALQTFYNSLGEDIEVQVGKKRVGTVSPLDEMLKKTGVKIKKDVLKRAAKIDDMEINEMLSQFCNVQKRAEGTGSLACSIEEVQNNIRGEARSALKTGKVGSKLGRLMSLGGKVFGLVDLPIELAFAMPHMLRGDKDAAKKAMIVGLFGAGRDKFERANEELGKDSATSKIYNFEKANEDFITAVTDAYNAKKSLDREDFEQLPNKIKQNAQKSLEENTEKAKSLYKVVNKNKPSLQNIIESKKELSDLQSKGTLGNFTYYGQGLDDNLNYYGGDVDLDAPIRAPYEGEDISKPTDFVEAQGDPMYPYQKKQGYLSKAVEDAYTGFTGKDILDRYSDVKLEDTQKLPEAEQDYLEQGFRELAMNIGPKATLKIMEEQGMDPSVLSGMFPTGYLERQGFSDGGMSRRGFLKLLGALGTTIGAAKTGLLKLAGKETTKQVTEQVVTPSNVEKIYLDLINVVKNKGILKRLDSDLETKVGEVYEYKGVKVLEDGENIELRFETDTGAPAVVEYRKPGYEVDPDAGTSQQVPGEFIYEAQEIGRYGPDGDVDLDYVEEIVDPIQNVTNMADEVFETYVYKSPANRVPTTETQKAIRNKHLKEGGEHYSLLDETIDD